MSRYALVLCLLAAAGCAAPTVADKGRTIQGALAAGKAACLILMADQSIPRDASATAHCQAVLSGCPVAGWEPLPAAAAP